MSLFVIAGPNAACPGCGTVLVTAGLAPDQSIVCPACYATFAIRRAGFAPRTSRLAAASLILGMASVLGLCLTGIPAIIMGLVALRTIKDSQGSVLGRRLALAGVVTGAVFGILCAPFTPALLIPLVQALRSR